jgi:hypothetical protein
VEKGAVVCFFPHSTKGEHMSDSRDELAAMAMMALVVKYGYKWGEGEEERSHKGAVTAYKIADAMIKYKKEHGNGR